MDRGDWQALVHSVTKSRTRLSTKRQQNTTKQDTKRGRLDQRMNISTKAFIQEKEDVKKL